MLSEVEIFKFFLSDHLNERFTNRVTRSVPEIRSPHFYERPRKLGPYEKERASYFLARTE